MFWNIYDYLISRLKIRGKTKIVLEVSLQHANQYSSSEKALLNPKPPKHNPRTMHHARTFKEGVTLLRNTFKVEETVFFT